MIRKNFLLFLAILLSIITGCNNSNENISDRAYFGGHIVNPTSDFLILTKDTTVIDTSYLDEENNFSFEVEDVGEGFYHFQHGYESQEIYLAPEDSLLMWANTLEFEESLHFSGKGAEENNFLIELFLQNKKNTDLVLNYYKTAPEEFEHITDSIKEQRLQILDNLVEKEDIHEEFHEIAEKLVQYENYSLKEQYIYLVKKYYPEFSDDFQDDFFEYRQSINFNEKSFQTNPAYLRFLDNYLINLSMYDCKGSPTNNSCFDQNDIRNIAKRINLIDSLTDLPIIKYYFFKRLGSTGMVMGKNKEELRNLLQLLQDKNIPGEDYHDLVTLGSIQLAFIPGINVGNTPILTTDGEHISASKIIDKRTIFYIWSIDSPNHHREQHKRINELVKKYPDIDFKGINVDIGETSTWQNALRKYHYDMDNEFQLDSIKILDISIGSEVFKNYLNKMLFLNSSGTVIIGDANLYSPDFESRILEFLNL